jgi:hypothetical protein
MQGSFSAKDLGWVTKIEVEMRFTAHYYSRAKDPSTDRGRTEPWVPTSQIWSLKRERESIGGQRPNGLRLIR